MERALLTLVVDGPTRLRLYVFQGLLCVAHDAAAALRTEIRAGFATRCQADLLAAREGRRSTLGDDDARVTVSVSMPKSTYHRVQALADEANLGIAAWVRQAIAYALASTSMEDECSDQPAVPPP